VNDDEKAIVGSVEELGRRLFDTSKQVELCCRSIGQAHALIMTGKPDDAAALLRARMKAVTLWLDEHAEEPHADEDEAAPPEGS